MIRLTILKRLKARFGPDPAFDKVAHDRRFAANVEAVEAFEAKMRELDAKTARDAAKLGAVVEALKEEKAIEAARSKSADKAIPLRHEFGPHPLHHDGIEYRVRYDGQFVGADGSTGSIWDLIRNKTSDAVPKPNDVETPHPDYAEIIRLANSLLRLAGVK